VALLEDLIMVPITGHRKWGLTSAHEASASMHHGENPLGASAYGAPMVPNASVDRPRPDHAPRGEERLASGTGSIEQPEGGVRGRTQRLGKDGADFLPETRDTTTCLPTLKEQAVRLG
jgi:hypothetical protein